MSLNFDSEDDLISTQPDTAESDLLKRNEELERTVSQLSTHLANARKCMESCMKKMGLCLKSFGTDAMFAFI